jgi:hypothetical protein
MAVSDDYLAKMRRAVRVNQSDDVDAELKDLVDECRIDLISVGVIRAKANDEADSLILGAVRCFVRWKFGISNPDADKNREDYYSLRDELRRKRDYAFHAVTFEVADGDGSDLADVYITFNGETKQTAADGTAVFFYISEGVNQTYTIELEGYATHEADIDIAGTTTVTVTMEAA